MPKQGRCFNMRKAILFGPIAVEEERLATAASNSLEVGGEQKEE